MQKDVIILSTIFLWPILILILYLIYWIISKIINQTHFVIQWDSLYFHKHDNKKYICNINDIWKICLTRYIYRPSLMEIFEKYRWAFTKFNLSIYNNKNQLITKLKHNEFSVWKLKKIYKKLKQINSSIELTRK